MGSFPTEKPHAVCVPYPAQGHVTPMLKLAKLLHCRGFHVTFVNTEYNHRRLLRSRGSTALDGLPDFRFATIPDGLPPSDANTTQDIAALCHSTMTTCLPHLRELLAELNDSAASSVPPVTCVVSDSVMTFALDAAKEIDVPCALLWTASACGFMGYRHYRQLIEKGIFPLKDHTQLTNGYLDMAIDWVPGMSKHFRLKDFPSFVRTTDRDDIIFNFVMRETERASRASAYIVNTFNELEWPVLDAMTTILPPIYSIGPLLNLLSHVPEGPVSSLGSNLWKEDQSSLEWLQGKKPGSVVYVNYGSITVMTNEQLVEFAWGLANSEHDFLWIIRPDLVKGDTAVLPKEFLKETKGRGLLASWCPQEEVLRHEAIGVFLTHSGWNSILESICGGVPMLSWPFFAEQQTNCRYMCMEWGVGMEIGDNVQQKVVERMIREVMDGEKGKEMKRRTMEWKESAARATQPGGQSFTNLEKLVNEVLLSKKTG